MARRNKTGTDIDRWLPISKRGANLSRAFDRLKDRIGIIGVCASDGLDALEGSHHPSDTREATKAEPDATEPKPTKGS